MSGKTEVNCGLSLSAILKVIPSSNKIYGRHSHAMYSVLSVLKMGAELWIQNTAVTASGVCFIA